MSPVQLQTELIKLGLRLRNLRHRQGWTLGELAQRVEVSEAYLSRLEGGDRQPSLAVLLSLAQAYGITLPSLFESQEDASSCVVVRMEDGAMRQGNGLSYTSLTRGDRFTNLHPIRVIVPTNRQESNFYEHEGEEWLYVLSGQLELIFTDEIHQLKPGDAAHFDARQPHRLRASGDQNAEIIVVACVRTRSVLESYLYAR